MACLSYPWLFWILSSACRPDFYSCWILFSNTCVHAKSGYLIASTRGKTSRWGCKVVQVSRQLGGGETRTARSRNILGQILDKNITKRIHIFARCLNYFKSWHKTKHWNLTGKLLGKTFEAELISNWTIMLLTKRYKTVKNVARYEWKQL